MSQFFDEGGLGMYPTVLLGLTSLALALVFAARPQQRLFPLVVGTGSAALFAGALGMLQGVRTTAAAIASARELAPDRLPVIALAGFAESANNLVLALSLCVCVALALGVGGFRARVAVAAP
ncbi:MAG: hypothetical protein IPJ65_03560 [Archangiaceae bacterium]|nr:hypothetical protein [Archangiaceae bacterium]